MTQNRLKIKLWKKFMNLHCMDINFNMDKIQESGIIVIKAN